MSSNDASFLMRTHVDAMVPLAIQEIARGGGITDEHINLARSLSWDLAECGDILIYRSDKKDETAKMMNKLVEGLAILAFLPGGVTFLGVHFEAERKK